MAKTLTGIDVSHHNQHMQDMHDVNELDFIIMKATEGKSYRDRSLPVWLAHLNDDMLKGLYHFCRADLGNSPVDEARNFLQYTEYARDDHTMLALDVEAGALRVKNIDKWCAVWMELIYNETGIKPMLYTSESYCHLFKEVAKFGSGLWCAKWSNNPPKKIKPFAFTAIWQYTSNEIISGVRTDMDKFFGSREQFLKYCEDMRNEKRSDTND